MLTEVPVPWVLRWGPPRTQVGKSTLISCLVKHYTRQNLSDVRGPITVVAGKKRRMTFVECPSDLCGMMVGGEGSGEGSGRGRTGKSR